jgi:ABC-type nickel/cobalt efflux system permease component RcnA
MTRLQEFFCIADTANADISPLFLLILCALVIFIGAFVLWDAHRHTVAHDKAEASFDHALDAVRMSWLEDHEAQTLYANDQWCVLMLGKVVAVAGRLREAVDMAREQQ